MKHTCDKCKEERDCGQAPDRKLLCRDCLTQWFKEAGEKK